MKRLLRSLYGWMALFGFDPRKALGSLRGLPPYLRDLRALKKQRESAVEDFPLGNLYPCLEDRFSESGSARGHYFYQDLWVAQRIYLNNPNTHVDVGSRVDGFVAHVAAFRPIKVIDIRPLSSRIPNVEFVQADLMADVRDDLVGCCDSLSCLHALEHFGLGRYGDPVRYDGYRVGLKNLYRMLKDGGKFYLSVPIGPQRIEFNAHRVFSVRYLLECFAGSYRIDQFSFVDDQGEFHEGAPLRETDIENAFGCTYGCGIFELTKSAA